MIKGIVLVLAALLLSACGEEAPASTTVAETRPATEASKSTAAPETPEPPSELALIDDDPLCTEVDDLLNNLLIGNIGSASDYSDFEQQLPPALRGQTTTGPIPTVSVASRAEARAVDAHTTEQCGVPFVQSAIHIAITCEVIASAEMLSPYLSDWGPCADPRRAPGSALLLSEQMDELETLEQAIATRSS